MNHGSRLQMDHLRLQYTERVLAYVDHQLLPASIAPEKPGIKTGQAAGAEAERCKRQGPQQLLLMIENLQHLACTFVYYINHQNSDTFGLSGL